MLIVVILEVSLRSDFFFPSLHPYFLDFWVMWLYYFHSKNIHLYVRKRGFDSQ